MDKELEQFFQPWELKLLEIIEEAKKEKIDKTNKKLNNDIITH
ncbi:MAG: hypothetical protein WC376_02680 [Candidatus Nanoarchaeia archaeon]|jgi:hypothetical protein